MSPPGGIPFWIVTGFLGSGKTTVLRRVLARPEMERSHVLVNEIADIGFDHQFLKPVNGSVRLIDGECVCCGGRDALRNALLDFVEISSRAESIATIILETTGIADPGRLMDVVAAHPMLNDRIRIMGVLTLVDCVNAASNSAGFPEFTNQISSADHILMTKMDLVDDETIKATVSIVRQLNPFAQIVHGDDQVLALLAKRNANGARETRPGALPQATATASHTSIRAFCLLFPGAFDWERFAIWLSLLVHAYGQQVLRIKGVLNIAGADKPVAINCVQQLVYFPEHLNDRPNGDERSILGFIVSDLDPDRILQSLKTFLGTDHPRFMTTDDYCAKERSNVVAQGH